MIGLLLNSKAVDKLATPEGRADLAAFYREMFGVGARHGSENPEYLAAAEAVERGDWPRLGRLLRQVERNRRSEDLARRRWEDHEHRNTLTVVRLLCSLKKGADLWGLNAL